MHDSKFFFFLHFFFGWEEKVWTNGFTPAFISCSISRTFTLCFFSLPGVNLSPYMWYDNIESEPICPWRDWQNCTLSETRLLGRSHQTEPKRRSELDKSRLVCIKRPKLRCPYYYHIILKNFCSENKHYSEESLLHIACSNCSSVDWYVLQFSVRVA